MQKTKVGTTYFGLHFIATGAETNGRYFLSETFVPAGDMGPPPHTHAHEDEGFFLKRGQLQFTINGKTIVLKAGEFLTIEKGEKHTWKNDGDEDAELMVTFAPAGIENMFVELDQDSSQIKSIGEKYGTHFEL